MAEWIDHEVIYQPLKSGDESPLLASGTPFCVLADADESEINIEHKYSSLDCK